MPLKLNVGLSRKVGEANYGSRGASVNVELEVDSGLVAEPAKLRERIRQLFGLVRASLAEELNGGNSPAPAPPSDANPEPRPRAANGNGPNRPIPPRGNGPRPATQSQVKATFAIARGRRLDLTRFLQERFKVGRPDDLSIGEAS
jgi:hypothetical protein